ncbi:MAG: 50S ribosomal protein L11 methyltransferase, partial [Kiritimatiellae bacterium]|nr:50S ribosomal protein L11 methyltransferase [Kiritimatiellia bacterium]
MASVDSDLYAEAPVLRASIPVPAGAVDLLLDAACGADPAPGAFQNLETGECRIEIYGVDRAAIMRSCQAVYDAADAIGIEPGSREPLVEPLPREDWAESWKKQFRVIRVSRRVTVRPPWEEYEPSSPDEIVVVIEPGMSFGTGLHETTQGCLSILEKLAGEPNGTARGVADLGCGSGILSIAARKLGFSPVAGVDYDAAAVRVSAENAAANGVADASFAQCDVTCDPIPGAEIVVANILAPVLKAAAPRV